MMPISLMMSALCLVKRQVSEFFATLLNVLRHVCDAMADSQDKRSEKADTKDIIFIVNYEVGDQTLLDAKLFPTNVVSDVFKTKLLPRFIGPFTVVDKKRLHYTLD